MKRRRRKEEEEENHRFHEGSAAPQNEREEFEWENSIELPGVPAVRLRSTRDARERRAGLSARAQEYRAKTPQFNYSEFTQVGAQYYDSEQRQYRLAMGSNPARATLVARGVIRTKRIYRPSHYMTLGLLQDEFDGLGLGTQMLHMKLPIALRGRGAFPRQGDRLQLYQPRSQTTLTCRVRSVYYQANASTGYAIVDNTVLWGKVANPEFYASFITRPTPRDRHRRSMRFGLKKRRV